ncbi:MAG: hypothetical protein IEMM0003_0862 [bacterium]|nr:MAG: hypothetical protein IEMM0003_0862 [bacterium]
MIPLSAEKLASEAASTGFRPNVFEKVTRLFELLSTLQQHPFLKGKLALKGGTALNLFVFDVPRLSVDIDLNYIGAEGSDAMIQERPKIEQAISSVLKRDGFEIRRVPEKYAGGKWLLRYQSVLGQRGNLELDINFMYRVPLWPVKTQHSRRLGSLQISNIPVMDIHELAAGKLAALLARHKVRDLFDSHLILTTGALSLDKIRIAFVVYGAMNRKDWRSVSIKDANFDASELTNQLIPTLRLSAVREVKDARIYGKKLVDECMRALSILLPLNKAEQEFLNLLLDRGKIDPTLLTSDEGLQKRILRQPLLKWKAINVRQYKSLHPV